MDHLGCCSGTIGHDNTRHSYRGDKVTKAHDISHGLCAIAGLVRHPPESDMPLDVYLNDGS